jgi:adenine-specific DNA methylase
MDVAADVTADLPPAQGATSRSRLFEAESTVSVPHTGVANPCALEVDFPNGSVSRLAEKESWRKEVHRPATHTHKWWAQRLGTVFRAILAASVSRTAAEAKAAYASPLDLSGLTVFDPFAGSGTTVVEARKAGATVVARDINPVATLVQRQALQAWDADALRRAYVAVEDAARGAIDELYLTAAGERVLYYFWVAVAQCPACATETELFSSYVFARHAYARRHPTARATCPHCHAVITVDLSEDREFACESCGTRNGFDGPVNGALATCPEGHGFRIVDALAAKPPSHRMYAKLVLNTAGKKRYEPIDDFDRALFVRAGHLLRAENHALVLPIGELEDGYNTRQAMRWGYREWRQFFNDRQLYCLGVLGAAVRDLPDSAEREALVALFSGTLEFNNLFCSYKGEGTGAVRHMFSHHVLRPERTPLEAHPWGTACSSGSFSTLFESRLIRALDYKQAPHDLVLDLRGGPRRVIGLSRPLAVRLDGGHRVELTQGQASVTCGDSGVTGLPDGSVDLVVTDPPFMDNVHYSELADFFHAWLRGLRPFAAYPDIPTTRSASEVQATTPEQFGAAIFRVWQEAARVLKADGLVAFTFHQARIEGWVVLVEALAEARLVVTSVQPIKSEMSVAAPKSGAKAPSNLDSIVVCRKRGNGPRQEGDPKRAADLAYARLDGLRGAGIRVGPTDVRSVVWGSVLALYTRPELGYGLGELVERARNLAEEVVSTDASSDRSQARHNTEVSA